MIALAKYRYGLYVYRHFLSYSFVKYGSEFALARPVGSHTLAVAIHAGGKMAISMAVAWMSHESFDEHFFLLKHFWSVSGKLAVAPIG
jgi:hypothetical protein